MEHQKLIEKIKRLPQGKVAEVEDFVDSLAVIRLRGILMWQFKSSLFHHEFEKNHPAWRP
jgi:hypothetical protein